MRQYDLETNRCRASSYLQTFRRGSNTTVKIKRRAKIPNSASSSAADFSATLFFLARKNHFSGYA
jgi:hypothetical protein